MDWVCACAFVFNGLKLLLTVTLPAALCPEEAESALEATHFFTDDDTPQGNTYLHIHAYITRHIYTYIALVKP